MKKVLVFVFSMFFAVAFINAQDITIDGDTTSQVKVGNVETPVYYADISWTNLIFDWAYLGESEGYGWKVHPYCHGIGVDSSAMYNYYVDMFGEGKLFLDSECENETYEYVANADYYVNEEDYGASIYIVDGSSGGKLSPSINFAANNNYQFTTMGYKYLGMDGQDHSFAGGVLPAAARVCGAGDVDENTGALSCDARHQNVYNLSLDIGIDTTKTITTPTPGATIGTITVSFTTN